MHGGRALAFAALVACPSPPNRPVATIELQANATFVQGKRLDGVDGGSLDGMTIRKALDLDGGVPSIRVAREVAVDRVYKSFLAATRMAGEPDVVRVEEFGTGPVARIGCSGSPQDWQVRAPSYSVGGLGMPGPPIYLVTVALTPKGFYVVMTDLRPHEVALDAGEPLPGEPRPTIPLAGRSLNFAGLARHLAVLKADHRDVNRAAIAAEGVTAGDLCKALETLVPYFADVTIHSF
jgi:hypothetical protein